MEASSLSSTLKQYRIQADLSQTEAARRADLSQAGVARFETGMQVPTPDQVRALCRVYKIPASQRAELVAAAGDLRAGMTAARPVLSRGTGWKIQARIGRIERDATLIREFQPLIIPGLLQTEEYMRAVFGQRMTPADRDRAVAERLTRQARLSIGQEARLVVPEGALWWQAGSPAVMAAQLDHVTEVAARGWSASTGGAPAVQVGLIPWDRPVDVFPVHGFTAYDAQVVLIGTWAGSAFVTGPDVAVYVERFEALGRLAVYGEEAAAAAAAAAARYRALA